MFASDTLVLPLALQMTKDMQLTPVEKMFVYTAIQHTESLDYAQLAEEGLKDIVKSLAGQKSQKKYMKMLPSAKAHVDVLERFGRYCHRNQLLGRESTPEEKKFLATAGNNFIRSVMGPKSTPPRTIPPKPFGPTCNIRPMRVLLLHGFRQNATVIRDAMKPLLKQMKIYPIEFITLNSPMLYKPGTTPFGDSTVTHHTWSTPNEYLRCWWNASDDGRVYRGWEASVRYVEQAWLERGGWDGVVAFSQGATLASLLSSMPQLSCSHSRFAILISGSPSRATAHQAQFEKKILGVKTLNIYGVQDAHLGPPEEMKERTLKLASIYQDPEILEHGGGHFTPLWWPLDKMKEFILDNATPVETSTDGDLHEIATKPIMERLDVLTRYWVFHIGDARALPTFNSPELKHLTGMCPYDDAVATDVMAVFDALCTKHPDTVVLDDLFVLTFYFNHRFYKKCTHTHFRDMLAKLAVDAPEYIISHFALIIKFGHWRDLNTLILDNYSHIESPTPFTLPAKRIHQAIMDYMAAQLKADAAVIASQSQSRTGEEGEGTDFATLSILALYIPRIKGAIDNKTHFSRDLAMTLRPQDDKLTAYVGFQKLYRSICTVLENSSLDRSTHSHARQMEMMPQLTVEQRKTVLSMPPNLFVTTPEEVPVAPCPMADLTPLITYLTSNPSQLPKENVKFVRGSIVPVSLTTGPKGVVDLCKQVVGPEGVAPLLESLMMCKRVEGLLLGNNITGSKGAREIAKCIRREDNQITTWYLGGNQFGPEDIAVISRALEPDTKAQALWLKRNPVLPEGTGYLARMLAVNSTLTTLDISNCGVLDAGCIALFREGMMHNHTMKHLYLNTNGISKVGCHVIAEYFEAGGTLESLYMSCNPIGDEGTEILAKSLKANTTIVRLGLASCAIGEIGITALCETFPTLPNLEYLNLGFTKGTYIFNGLPNYLGLGGITKLCAILSYMPSLRYLDINHNQIPPEGLQLLLTTLRALPEGQGLTTLMCGQFGQERSGLIEGELKEVLLRNAVLWGKTVVGGDDENLWKRAGLELNERAVCPDHVKEIMSVTRNVDI